MKRPALRGLPYLFLLVFLYCTVTTPGQAQQQEGEREEQTLELSTLAVNVDSDLRFVLPAGTISEQVTRSFRHLDIEFAVSYTLLDSDTAGSILFRYPVWMLEPRIEFAYSLDFEQTVSPRLENGELELIAGDKYLSRLKEVDLGIRLTPFAGFHVTPSFRITSLFKGDLDEAVVVDRGTDYSAILSWGYDSLESREAERGLLFEGTRYLSSVKLVSRDRLDNPAHADSSNDLLLRFTAGSLWRFKQRFRLNLPVYVWQEELSTFYSLGGLDSLPGYGGQSVHNFRYCLANLSTEREFRISTDLSFPVGDWTIRIHQFALSLFTDVALIQDRLPLDSKVGVRADLGAGISFVITAKDQGHIDVRLYLARAVDPSLSPVFYLETSLFSLREKI